MVFISCLITSIDFCQKTIGNKRSHTSTLRLNGTPSIQKTLRDEHGAFEKVIIFRYTFPSLTGGPNSPPDLKFVGTVGTGGPVKFFLAV